MTYELTETIPFNFDEIYSAVSTKLAEKGYDAIYEGSNTAQLVTAMSYLVSMLNANTAANINEMLLPLAQKRNNILSDARILGYEISHISSYKYRIVLEFTAGNHTIPKYSEFKSGDYSYWYTGNTITLENVTAGHQVTLEVSEGTLKKHTDFPDTLKIITGYVKDLKGNTIPQYYVDIPYTNVEEDGIEVFLTYYDEFGNLHQDEPWEKSSQFMIDKDSELNRKYVRLDNIEFQTPRLYFKLAEIGDGLRIGTTVEMNILVSSGEAGEMLELPSTTILNATPISYTLVLQGAAEESSDSVRTNAPLFHNSANRAITKSDYIAICVRHQAVEKVEVWGGDDEYPKVPGHIWFSFRPSTLSRAFENDEFKLNFDLLRSEELVNWYIEDEEIRSNSYDENNVLLNPGVWDVLDDYKVPTLIFNNRHPIYIDFEYDIAILKYNIKTSKADIHQEIFTRIDNFFLGINEPEVFETFDREYFHSNLEKRIDIELDDITGFNNSIKTSLMITSKNLNTEQTNKGNMDIFIPLSIPYENYFIANAVDTTKLPIISALGITIDWTTLVGDKNSDIITADIKIGSDIVGKYSLFNTERRDIMIQLYVKDTSLSPDGVYMASTLVKEDFNSPVYFTLNYASPNFKAIKNCIPRLKSVKFL